MELSNELNRCKHLLNISNDNFIHDTSRLRDSYALDNNDGLNALIHNRRYSL